MSTRLSAAKWAELIAAWESSGSSARAFAEERGVAEASLRWWKSELARRARHEPARRSPGPRERGERAVAIARVVRSKQSAPAAPSELVVAIGPARIVVQRDFDAAHLRAVVRALREAT
jgi:hypothetical protein